MPDQSEEICLECGHRRGDHDGAGCNFQIQGMPCHCETTIDMPGSQPSFFPSAAIAAQMRINESR